MMAEKKPLKSKVLLDVHIPGKWILGVLVALGVLFVAAVIGFSAVNRIDTCETCHIIKPEVATYKQSAHYRAGVGCQKCHTKPGVFNYFIRNIQGVTNLILYVSDTYQRPITTYVGADNCAQCHTNEQIEKDLVVGNIRVNHKGLREAGYQCLTCHANISHPGTRPRWRVPARTRCRSARAVTTASSFRTTATSATSAASRRTRPRSP